MDELLSRIPSGSSEAMTSAQIAGEMLQPTLTARLGREQETLEARLSEVKEAIAALKANPEIERVLNLVGKVKSRY